MDELRRVLGPPVEPPEEVWATALSGAFDDPRSADDLADLVPPDGGGGGTDAPAPGEQPEDGPGDPPDDWDDLGSPAAEDQDRPFPDHDAGGVVAGGEDEPGWGG